MTTSTPTDSQSAQLVQRVGLDTGNAAVVGLQWGDEGKGQIVDLLTEHFGVVTRFNGGNNAGHSVYVGDQKFALHLLPSGIIRPGSLNVIGNGVVVDPSPETGILKEIRSLTERGVPVSGETLKISDRAHAVMPYHKAEDQLFDLAVAKAFGNEPIGTTGRGIGPTYADKAQRSTAVRMGDLIEPDRLRAKLRANAQIKNATLSALAKSTDHDYEPFDADELCEKALAWGEELKDHITDTRRLLHGLQSDGQQILFEGANAALLDVDHGTYPFVTSSTTCALGIGPGTGVPPTPTEAGHRCDQGLHLPCRGRAAPHRAGGCHRRAHPHRRQRVRHDDRTPRVAWGWLDLTAVPLHRSAQRRDRAGAHGVCRC